MPRASPTAVRCPAPERNRQRGRAGQMLQICQGTPGMAMQILNLNRLRVLSAPPMRRLFSLLALCLALVLGAAPSFAADAAHGAQVFSANCAACHMGGGNVVNAERTLKADALKAYLANYADGPEAAVAYQVTNGKNAMPAFGGKLSEADIADVAAYVIDQSAKGWA